MKTTLARYACQLIFSVSYVCTLSVLGNLNFFILMILQTSIDIKTEDSQFSESEFFSDVVYCMPLKDGPPDIENIGK